MCSGSMLIFKLNSPVYDPVTVNLGHPVLDLFVPQTLSRTVETKETLYGVILTISAESTSTVKTELTVNGQ